MQKNYAEVIERDERLKNDEADEMRIIFYETKDKEEFLPVEHDIPAHDGKTQVAGVSGYDVQKDKVVVKYKVEDKPQRGQRFSVEEFADMIAEKVVERQR